MKFKIIKEVKKGKETYFTQPTGWGGFIHTLLKPFHFNLFEEYDPERCFDTKEQAQLHIKRLRNGYYKKRNYTEEV